VGFEAGFNIGIVVGVGTAEEEAAVEDIDREDEEGAWMGAAADDSSGLLGVAAPFGEREGDATGMGDGTVPGIAAAAEEAPGVALRNGTGAG